MLNIFRNFAEMIFKFSIQCNMKMLQRPKQAQFLYQWVQELLYWYMKSVTYTFKYREFIVKFNLMSK